jgi:uncharacterized protein YndB with AHSA1/START domain
VKSTFEESAATSLTLARELPAPRAQVWDIWTDVDLAREWWGPEGVETEELLCEPRPGGMFRWVVRTPRGDKMSARGTFREVHPEEKIVYTWAWDDDPQWENHDSVVTVEFNQKDDETTELRLRHEGLPTEESRDNHAAGWNGALDKLARLVQRLR